MIVENPYTQPHYLTMFFPVEPRVIIRDRSEEGDYFTKPTQFFFMNCEPEQNVILTPLERVDRVLHNNPSNLKDGKNVQVKRSLMHPQFAERFIKIYILTKDDGLWI